MLYDEGKSSFAKKKGVWYENICDGFRLEEIVPDEREAHAVLLSLLLFLNLLSITPSRCGLDFK